MEPKMYGQINFLENCQRFKENCILKQRKIEVK